MKNHIARSAAAAVALIILSQPILAQPAMGMGIHDRGDGKMKAELNLTDDQEQQVQNLKLEFDKALIPLKAELETRKLEMRELRMADKPNKKKLYGKIDDISATKAKMAKAHLDHKLAMEEILTPEQQKLFRMKGMREKGKSGGMQCQNCGGRDSGHRRGHHWK